MKKTIYFFALIILILGCDNREFDDSNVITSFDYTFTISEKNINGTKDEFNGFYDEKIPFILEIDNTHELKDQTYDIEYEIISGDSLNMAIWNSSKKLSKKFTVKKGQLDLSLLSEYLGDQIIVFKCSNGTSSLDKLIRLKFNIKTRTFELIPEHLKANEYLYPFPKEVYKSLGDTKLTLNSLGDFKTMDYKLYIKPKAFGIKGKFLYNGKDINFNEAITPEPTMYLTYIPQSISSMQEPQVISFQVVDKFGNVVEQTIEYKVKLDIDYAVKWIEDNGKVIPQFSVKDMGQQTISNGAEKYQDNGNTSVTLSSKSDLTFFMTTSGSSDLAGNLLLGEKSYSLRGNVNLKEGNYIFTYVNRNTGNQQKNNFKFKNSISYVLTSNELDLQAINSANFTKNIEYSIYKTPILTSQKSIRSEAGRTNGSSERYRKYFYKSAVTIEVEEQLNNGVSTLAIYGKGKADKFGNLDKYIGAKHDFSEEKDNYKLDKNELHFLYDPSQRRSSSLRTTFDIDDPIYYYIEDNNGIKSSFQGTLNEGEDLGWSTDWSNVNSSEVGKAGNILFLK